jgi:hypothetical protein
MHYSKGFAGGLVFAAFSLVAAAVAPVSADPGPFFKLILRDGVEHGQLQTSGLHKGQYKTCSGDFVQLKPDEHALSEYGECKIASGHHVGPWNLSDSMNPSSPVFVPRPLPPVPQATVKP